MIGVMELRVSQLDPGLGVLPLQVVGRAPRFWIGKGPRVVSHRSRGLAASCESHCEGLSQDATSSSGHRSQRMKAAGGVAAGQHMLLRLLLTRSVGSPTTGTKSAAWR